MFEEGAGARDSCMLAAAAGLIRYNLRQSEKLNIAEQSVKLLTSAGKMRQTVAGEGFKKKEAPQLDLWRTVIPAYRASCGPGTSDKF